MKFLALTSVVAALRCWSNGNGVSGTAPFKYNLDLADGTNCVHQIYGNNEYYTALSDAQLKVTIDGFGTTPKGWPYGILSCQTDFCNDPSIKVETKIGTGPAPWTPPTGSFSNANSTSFNSGDLKKRISLLSIISYSISLF